jgi:hypothetical protein
MQLSSDIWDWKSALCRECLEIYKVSPTLVQESKFFVIWKWNEILHSVLCVGSTYVSVYEIQGFHSSENLDYVCLGYDVI